jgi:aspartyl aminopeptidase
MVEMAPESDSHQVDDLLSFIDASPSPWHAGNAVRERLLNAGAEELSESACRWRVEPGARYFIQRGESSVIAFRVGRRPDRGGIRLVAGHTDSPGFRIKPSGGVCQNGHAVVGAEIYGAPIVPTFSDRDLTFAGRVFVESDGVMASILVAPKAPLLRLPNAAIHLNRGVNTEGLRFDPQNELGFLFGSMPDNSDEPLTSWLSEHLGRPRESILGWDLSIVDSQPSQRVGPKQDYIASGQLDNLASCHAGLDAFLAADDTDGIAVFAAFDHEEVGSETYKGAASPFLQDVVTRLCEDLAINKYAALANGWLLSVDMTHGWHPLFSSYYDDANAPLVNSGPTIKINAKERYASDGCGEAYFASLCDRVDVPVQRYVHHGNIACGTTIGPILASRLGIRTIDVGNPMWAMHSVRECAGARDHGFMTRVLRAFYAND